jgi:tRNA threonylcarbamoyladenosine biosynthesis protein TsaE
MQISFSHLVNSPEETDLLAKELATLLKPGMMIALTGPYGAGKTYFVKSVAEALGIDRDLVVSPTFSLIQSYSGKLPLVHIDAWRIKDRDEYQELGIDEMMEGDSVVFMEWAERFESLLPSDRLTITIRTPGGDSREFWFACHDDSPLAAELGKRLRDRMAQRAESR